MPPRPSHGSPEEWLQRAQSSLALARQQGEGVLLEDLCYQAQQAAEKAVKALSSPVERSSCSPTTWIAYSWGWRSWGSKSPKPWTKRQS